MMAKKDMAAAFYKAAFRPWRCKAKYIQEIIDGAKTREGRPYTADSLKVCIGDYLNISAQSSWVVILCKVEHIQPHSSLTGMVTAAWKSLMPTCDQESNCFQEYTDLYSSEEHG